MQVKISVKRCPECEGIFNHSLKRVECIKCGYIIPKEKKKQTEAK